MTILEYQEQRLNLQDQLDAILANGQAEKRELNEEETNEMANLRGQIEEIDGKIAEIEAENAKQAKEQKNNKENKDNKMEIRLFDLVKEVANGQVSEEHRSFVSGNKINLRSEILAGAAGQGQENVPEEKKGLDVAIRNKSVLSKLGATWFGNAVGDISIPRYAGSNVSWKGEVAAADDGASAFTETILQPKRLTAYIDISKTFLAQDSNDAEAILINDLAAAVAEKLDKTVFGAGSGSTTQPAGLFSGDYISTGTALTAVTYDDVLDVELAVEEKNGDNFVFVASPNVKYALKGTQMASGLEMVYSKGEIDGYNAIVSNSVEKGGIIALDPRDLAVATWAGVDITVDTVSRAIYNEVRVVVNYLVDAKLRGNRIAGAQFSME